MKLALHRSITLLMMLIPSVCLAGPRKKKPAWTEYEANFTCREGAQPIVTIRWWSMDSDGPFQEYPEIWRKGMSFGHGQRFRVESLTGVDQDGKMKKGQVVEASILDTKTNKKIVFRSDASVTYKSYPGEWMQQRLLKFPVQGKQDPP